ncbi:MAG TPA: hypothetical protein VKH37_06570, partial [Ferruginibacter sp.]|nr:hypothetical protein [Ferruginibacter sp.]
MKRFATSLLLLCIATAALAQPGSWKMIGNAGEWANTIQSAQIGNKLYTVEKSGKFYVTDVTTGTWKQLGAAEFGNTKFMFPGNSML